MENVDTVSISQQSIKQTIVDDIEQQELSLDIESKLDDQMRIQIATELKTKIEKKIVSENQKAKKQGSKTLVVAYNKRMMDESDQLNLMRTAKRIIGDKYIPKDLQLVEMGQTLLFML